MASRFINTPERRPAGNGVNDREVPAEDDNGRTPVGAVRAGCLGRHGLGTSPSAALFAGSLDFCCGRADHAFPGFRTRIGVRDMLSPESPWRWRGHVRG